MNWAALIAELERHLTHAQIGRRVGRTESWVGQLKRGHIKEPSYSVGEKLVALGVKFGASVEGRAERRGA